MTPKCRTSAHWLYWLANLINWWCRREGVSSISIITAFLDKNSLTVPLSFLLKAIPHQSLLESLRTFVRQSGDGISASSYRTTDGKFLSEIKSQWLYPRSQVIEWDWFLQFLEKDVFAFFPNHKFISTKDFIIRSPAHCLYLKRMIEFAWSM